MAEIYAKRVAEVFLTSVWESMFYEVVLLLLELVLSLLELGFTVRVNLYVLVIWLILLSLSEIDTS
jgi:hypothetical protein